MSNGKPAAFVLVPGAFCLPAMYDLVVTKLRGLNHPVTAIHLPSVGKWPGQPPTNATDDAAFIANTATSYLDTGHNVVLVGHSYGGFPTTEASRGLSASERPNSSSVVVHIVYLASLLPRTGQTIDELVSGKQPMPTDVTTDYIDPLPAAVNGSVLCSELPEDEATRWGALCDAHSAASFKTPLTHEGWKKVPSTYVVAGRDKALDAKWQHENVDGAIAEGWDLRKVVLEGDHCLMISCVNEVVEVLLRAAGSW